MAEDVDVDDIFLYSLWAHNFKDFDKVTNDDKNESSSSFVVINNAHHYRAHCFYVSKNDH